MNYIQTSEYVSPGHPDKIADCISEALLDEYLRHDKNVRYAVEVLIKGNKIHLAGEVTSSYKMNFDDYERIVKKAIEDIGYTKSYLNKFSTKNITIDPDNIELLVDISEQSPDIAMGVNNDGWGDQGLFYGKSHFDVAARLAKEIGMNLYTWAKSSSYPVGIDIKTLVTTKDNKPTEVIVAIPMEGNYLLEVEQIVNKTVGENVQIKINCTGEYTFHGPIADTGITGRKLAVDFYGGQCKIGGGCPWTKDPTKADLTLNLMAHKFAVDKSKQTNKKIKTMLSCAIGSPVVRISYFDENGLLETDEVVLKPSDVINNFNLNEPRYFSACINGLFTLV